ncbi:polysaccharide biosynthesis/export family protein [Aestuariibius insulae]|uniref:polysaccharide biosynthesis/export family protein n=1 Tax=Aestuariibius insulae TaxID=2058287 RepID=UPI00345E0CF6
MAERYTVGAGDRLSVRVVIWEDTTRRYETWDAVSGEYVVQSGGYLMLPVAGRVDVAGQTTAELSDTIGGLLQTVVSFVQPPSTAVEVVQHRSFYVVGDVQQPGAYPAQPGLTVAQAIALAGGEAVRNLDELGAIRDAGAMRDLQTSIARADYRIARLRAEIDGMDSPGFPSETQHPDGTDALLQIQAEEEAVFASRKAAIDLETEALEELKALLTSEIEGLEATMDRVDLQIESARENLENMESLADRGLARQPQIVDAQRRLFDLENQLQAQSNALYRAQQSIKEADRDAVALRTRRSTDAATELQRVTADREALMIRRSTLREVAAQTGSFVGTADEDDIVIDLTISRDVDGSLSEFVAEPGQAIIPGDILRYQRRLREAEDGL